MFNSVEYVRELCKERKIAVSQLERECGFANGYLNPKKISKISYDRALVIADYLNISVEEIMHGQEKTPILTKKDERDIARDVERMMEDLSGSGELMFDGVPMSEEAKAAMAAAMRIGFEEARRRNKATYTPQKFREE